MPIFDISRQLKDILRKNGLRAHLEMDHMGNYFLVAEGRNYPHRRYAITAQQAEDMSRWGFNSLNDKAYNTIKRVLVDADMPVNLTVARLAKSPVNMGQYGENRWFGRVPTVPGYARPGTISTFSYRSGGLMPTVGVYYKGGAQSENYNEPQPLSVTAVPRQPKAADRTQGNGIPYSEAITSDVYFNKDEFLKILASHGIVIDEKNKTMTIRSSNTRVDLRYKLTDEELRILCSNSLDPEQGGYTLQARLEVINNNNGFRRDFRTGVKYDTIMYSRDLVDCELRPEIKEEVEKEFLAYDRYMERQRFQQEATAEMMDYEERIRRNPNAISGRQLANVMGNYGWYRSVEGGEGREVVVTCIRVDKQKDDKGKDIYTMSANINNQWKTVQISKKDYEKFLRYDDEHRFKLFDKLFDDIEIGKRDTPPYKPDEVVMIKTDQGYTYVTREELLIMRSQSAMTNGDELQALNGKKGFYREGRHGREVDVSDISVDKDPKNEGKYIMTAVIDGKTYTHSITQKQYDKFLAVDDYARMKMFAKIFSEVDLKVRPEHRENFGAMLMAALVGTTEMISTAAEMAAGTPYHPAPSYYASYHGSAAQQSAANYDMAEAQTRGSEEQGVSRGVGR